MCDTASEGASGRRERQRGQATVETVGIIVAIAILLAATGAFLTGGLPLPRPPDLIGAVARVLGAGAPRPAIDVPGPGGFVRADHGYVAGETHPPIGRSLDWAADRSAGLILGGGGMAPALMAAFGAGFADRVRERVDAVRDDPAGALLRAVRELRRSPEDVLNDLPGPVRIWRYANDVRAEGWREGSRRVSRDAGGLGADLTIEVVGRRLVRAGRGASRRPVPRDREPRAPRTGESLLVEGDGPRFLR